MVENALKLHMVLVLSFFFVFFEGWFTFEPKPYIFKKLFFLEFAVIDFECFVDTEFLNVFFYF